MYIFIYILYILTYTYILYRIVNNYGIHDVIAWAPTMNII